MIFEGYENDIKKSFFNVFKKEPESTDDFNLINVTLYTLLKSYYFEGNYDYSQLGYNSNGETFIAYIPNKKLEEELLNTEQEPVILSQYMRKKGFSTFKNPKNNDIDINDFRNFYSSSKSVANKNLNRLDINNIPEDVKNLINDLKKKNNLYEIIFEDSKIKQELLIKTKKDYKYSIVEQTQLDNFLKNNFKAQNLDIDNIYKCLSKNYDFRFFTKEYIGTKDSQYLDNKITPLKTISDNRNFLVIAHNEYEIAGICPVNNNATFKKVLNNNDFFNVTSVMVASNARGNGIGVNMFKEVIKEAEKRDIYLVRTGASNQGRNFLKSNIDIEVKNTNVPVINAEHVNHLYTPILDILKSTPKKEKQKTLINKLLNEVRLFQDTINLKKKNASSVDEVYSAENEEEKYLESLSSKKNKVIKNLKL